MKIIDQSYQILDFPKNALELIEIVARTCYKSEDKIKTGSSAMMVKNLIKSGREAMIEFADITVKFITDRGVSHEIVRHRLCSFAQESTRYANYAKDKFGNEITVIKPVFWDSWSEEMRSVWQASAKEAESAYIKLINMGAKAQEARAVLPNSLKTEINVKTNLREWRSILQLRCDSAAHPQIRALMIPLLQEFNSLLPEVFEDIFKKYGQHHEK